MDLPEYGSNSSSTCVCEPAKGDDDEVIESRDGEELLSDQLRGWLRMPMIRWERRMAESALRDAVAKRDGAPAVISRPTTFVENVAAGRERSVAPSAASPSEDRASAGDDAPAGRISRQTADRLARAVRELKPGEHDQAERILNGLLSAVGALGDNDLIAIYSEAIHMAADGQLVDAVADAIRQAPNGSNPRGLLRSKFRSLRAAKNPPPAYSPK